MSRNYRSLLASIFFFLAGFAFTAHSARAHQNESAYLLLPYFEVDLTGTGVNTGFSVVNSSPFPIEIEVSLHSNWGIQAARFSVVLGSDQARLFNLREWIVQGRFPNLELSAVERAHLQAILSGRASPSDGLYYATEILEDHATGYVTVQVADPQAPKAIFGDFSIVDVEQNIAEGDVLISIDPDEQCASLCLEHGLRFLSSSGLPLDTELVIWTARADQQPSSSPDFPDAARYFSEVAAMRDSGAFINLSSLLLRPLEVISVAELNLLDETGWLRVFTEEESFIGLRYSSEGRFRAFLQSVCLLGQRGGLGPGIEIEKFTNGQDADSAPGPFISRGNPVAWTYRVRNTGNVPLTEIAVTDDRGVDVSCPSSSLAPGQEMTCTGQGVAEACQYRNVARAVGQAGGVEVSDQDASHYFGSLLAAIRIEKSTNGVDADSGPGPLLQLGQAVEWTYLVSNSGEGRLDNVTVVDDRGEAVSCPRIALDPGESMTCTASSSAQSGQYRNVGTATGFNLCGNPVRDSDASHYHVPDSPEIRLEKSTNGHDADFAPGPTIGAGDAVEWTYRVTNTGDAALTDVSVSDDRLGAVSCPRSSLGIGESMTCVAQGTAQLGQYRNEGWARGTSPAGRVVEDHDPSHYLGVEPCGPCDGKVTQLTLRYLGLTQNAFVEVFQKKQSAPVFSGVLQPGETFSFVGTDDKGTLGPEIEIFVDGALNTQIHTSCSQPIGPGLVRGDFEVAAGRSRNGGPLCPVDEPPGSQCQPCEGKVTRLTLRYLGVISNAFVEVVQKKDDVTVFQGTVQPGGQFTFFGQDRKGTLGTEILVFVNGAPNAQIHTSCSQPIGPGLLFGDFEVVEGSSREGGLLCSAN